jgi:hypothetical protein
MSDSNDPKIGPTGLFPDGKLTPEDQGKLSIRLKADTEKHQVIISFGTPISCLSLDPDSALNLAHHIVLHFRRAAGIGVIQVADPVAPTEPEPVN